MQTALEDEVENTSLFRVLAAVVFTIDNPLGVLILVGRLMGPCR